MKRTLSVALAAGVVALLAGAALAQMGGGPAGARQRLEQEAKPAQKVSR